MSLFVVPFARPEDAPDWFEISSLGRSGLAATRGVEVMCRPPRQGTNGEPVPAVVTLTPITSRGLPQKCWIELPAEAMAQLCREFLARRAASEHSGDERFAAYVLEGGFRCPVCQSKEIHADEPEMAEESAFQAAVWCSSCGSGWVDVYQLAFADGFIDGTQEKEGEEEMEMGAV